MTKPNPYWANNLEATPLSGGRFAVRPKGQLGTLGQFPRPWEMKVIKTTSAEQAIKEAKRQGNIFL